MSLLHPIFTAAIKHGPAAARAVGGALYQAIGQRAANAAIDATLGFVQDGYDFFNGATDEQIANASSQAIGQSMAIVFRGEDTPGVVRDDTLAQRLLTELSTRDDGPRVLAECFKDKQETFAFPQPFGNAIVGGGDIVGCALGELQSENNLFKRTHFPADTKPANFIRRCSTRSSDGKRVSREAHEWSYVRESGQWGRIMRLAIDWAQGIRNGDIDSSGYAPEYLAAVDEAETLIALSGISSEQQDYTYGNFVDMHRTRKAIERYRKVQAIGRSANAKQILQLMGSTREQFVKLLEDRGQWLDVLEEMVNQNVQSGSSQTGAINAQGQLDATPGSND